MRQSSLFTKTRREAPADELSRNAQLLIRAGYVHKEMAGVYSYLPLGLRVLNNIINIIRNEMNTIGGQELVMSELQNPDIWKKTNRWEEDVWFKTSLNAGTEIGFGWTQEEAITRIASQYVGSYRDLPFTAYQIQTKFRNEKRAKSGIMRGREFLMKDLYSFDATQESHEESYVKVREAYIRIFNSIGIGDNTYVTFASGGAFSEFSEEFQTVSDAGEDLIYINEEKGIAFNKEILTDEILKKFSINRDTLVEKKSIEIGNIFHLGTRFSKALGLNFKDQDGTSKPVIMGGYGLGPTRVMGTIVETLSDGKGIIWPEAVAPFKVHLVSLAGTNKDIRDYSDALYTDMGKRGIEVLYDDRNVRAGEKFADSDLLGIPRRVIVGREATTSDVIEVVNRATGMVEKKPRREVLSL